MLISYIDNKLIKNRRITIDRELIYSSYSSQPDFDHITKLGSSSICFTLHVVELEGALKFLT